MNLIDQRHVVTLPSCFQSFLHCTPLYTGNGELCWRLSGISTWSVGLPNQEESIDEVRLVPQGAHYHEHVIMTLSD